MLGCFSWTKRGTHDLLWPKKKIKINIKNRVLKIIVIGYAYLSQGKHITTELKTLLKQQRS